MKTHLKSFIFTLLFLPLSIYAVCTPQLLTDKVLNVTTYSGNVGNTPITVALTSKSDGSISARYAYKNSKGNVLLTGSLSSNSQIKLIEYNALDKPAAEFKGIFLEHDPKNGFGSSLLQCEVISGTWYSLKNKRNLPFYLRMNYKTSGTLTNMYRAAGVKNDEIINQAASRFQHAVAEDNKKLVAQMIHYPITIHLKSNQQLVLRNRSDFIKNYQKIFTPSYKKAIADEIPRLLFSRYDGVSLGAGLVWFNAEGKVITLNIL